MRRLAVVAAAFTTLVLPATAYGWTWPASGEVLEPFVFGGDPYAGGQHRGVDIAGEQGSFVLAPASGDVAFAGTVGSNGKVVTIETTDGYSVTLVQLGSFSVRKGDTVREGATVGAIGPSGTPEHEVPYVHLGIRVTSDPQGYVDPLTLLPPRAAPAPPPPPPSPAPPPASSSPLHRCTPRRLRRRRLSHNLPSLQPAEPPTAEPPAQPLAGSASGVCRARAGPRSPRRRMPADDGGSHDACPRDGGASNSSHLRCAGRRALVGPRVAQPQRTRTAVAHPVRLAPYGAKAVEAGLRRASSREAGPAQRRSARLGETAPRRRARTGQAARRRAHWAVAHETSTNVPSGHSSWC